MKSSDALKCVHEAVDAIHVPDGFAIDIRGNSAKMEIPAIAVVQVIQNLITNAISHHDRDQGSITIQLSETSESVNIAVTDDGPGIPAEFQSRIFQPFKTLKRRDEHETSGIGLTIVRRLLDRTGGKISVASLGRGTTFSVAWSKQGSKPSPVISLPVQLEPVTP